jgi:hypothetical protein
MQQPGIPGADRQCRERILHVESFGGRRIARRRGEDRLAFHIEQRRAPRMKMSPPSLRIAEGSSPAGASPPNSASELVWTTAWQRPSRALGVSRCVSNGVCPHEAPEALICNKVHTGRRDMLQWLWLAILSLYFFLAAAPVSAVSSRLK